MSLKELVDSLIASDSVNELLREKLAVAKSAIVFADTSKQHTLEEYSHLAGDLVSYNIDESTRDMYEPFKMYLEKYFFSFDYTSVFLTRSETEFTLRARTLKAGLLKEILASRLDPRTEEYFNLIYNLYTDFEFLSFNLALEQYYGHLNLGILRACFGRTNLTAEIIFTSRYNLYTTFEFLSFQMALYQRYGRFNCDLHHHYGNFNLDELIDCARAETLELLDETVLRPVATIVLDYIY